MKKTIILLSALFMAGAAGAQVTWEARLGAAVSKFTEMDTKMKLGMKAGVGMEYGFSDLFAVKPGLYFAMKGSSRDNSFAIGNGDALNLSYLEIPVLASFRWCVANDFRIAFNAGPYAALRLNSPDGGEGLKKGDFGVAAGLDFIMGPWVVSPEVEYGLVKVSGYGDDRNLAYFLSLGYRF